MSERFGSEGAWVAGAPADWEFAVSLGFLEEAGVCANSILPHIIEV